MSGSRCTASIPGARSAVLWLTLWCVVVCVCVRAFVRDVISDKRCVECVYVNVCGQNLVYELWLAPYRRVKANDSSG